MKYYIAYKKDGLLNIIHKMLDGSKVTDIPTLEGMKEHEGLKFQEWDTDFDPRFIENEDGTTTDLFEMFIPDLTTFGYDSPNPGVHFKLLEGVTQEEADKKLSEQWEIIRLGRNDLLTKSDWTQLTDSPLTAEKKEEWATYRQKLRDMPQSDGSNPFTIFFPDQPE